jgi:hypothetical protein
MQISRHAIFGRITSVAAKITQELQRREERDRAEP